MPTRARKAKLIVEALVVQKSESGCGLIYQDGKITSGNRNATEFAFQQRGVLLATGLEL